MKRISLAAFALPFASPVPLAREPKTDPRQWMIELEGEPAVESWLKAGGAGRKSALGVSVARVTELESAQSRVEERLTTRRSAPASSTGRSGCSTGSPSSSTRAGSTRSAPFQA
ncbi:MAG: hypothetical protein IPL90_12730 [Holophagales bacterium]|nr:hypothetical protein [Holophagales bacterium]